ncbi:unnamed protein product, partial [Arctogadus glacialis]
MDIDPKHANEVQALTENVEEVMLIVDKTVEMVKKRGVKLSNLKERAEALKEGCTHFQKTSIRMKRSYDEENSCCNQKTCILVVGVLVIILIIVLLATGVIPAGSSSSTPPPPNAHRPQTMNMHTLT